MELDATHAVGGEEEPKRIVLLPVDDSEATSQMVEWLIASFYKPGDLIQVMHVIPKPVAELMTGVGFEYVPVILENDPANDLAHISAARQFIKKRVGDRLTVARIPFKTSVVHFLMDNNSIGEAVCARATHLQADVVVMSKHQRGALATLLLGSVTDYCLKHLKQPLVLLH